MRPGASPDRTSFLRPVVVSAAFLLASACAIILLCLAGAPPAARAATLDGPTPTYDPLLVPTAPAPASGGLIPSAISINPYGFAPIITLSCVTTIVGLILAIVALLWLRRGGYGPFLRALLPGRLRGPLMASHEPDARHPASGSRSRAREDRERWDAPPRRRARRGSSRGSRS